ncbi:hypothetical protein [Anaerosalibacter sp. Marseille-P3206]|uniref:hypothetical protein n=1 Tax=Anaerosalibacter sp. Marseille-P3206 TaxID=1871005 RepID=UPI0009847166|nr:hypothetical protein [Anaerosalibacter sp. Marseille-P3206]
MKKNIIIAILIIIGSIVFLKINSKYDIGFNPTTRSGVQIGWIEHSGSDNIGAKYTKFSGSLTKKIKFNEGDVAIFHYESIVKDGNLSIVLLDSEGKTIIEFETDKKDEVVEITKSGKYTVKVIGEDTKGSFNINWEVE